MLEEQDLHPVEIGNLVKMQTRSGTVYGMVSRLEVADPGLEPTAQDFKTAEIEFAGEIGSGASTAFKRGISGFPSLDVPVLLATPSDLAKSTHVRMPRRPPSACFIRPEVPAYLLVDDLLGKHFSIVGTTGSGKSCAVATILRAVIDHNPNAHVILLDPHNEYARAFGGRAAVLSPGDGLHLPYWLFNFEELAEIVLGAERHPEQGKILGEAVLAAKQLYFAKAGLERRARSIPRCPTACRTSCGFSTRRWGA